jgi:hypothetical protein
MHGFSETPEKSCPKRTLGEDRRKEPSERIDDYTPIYSSKYSTRVPAFHQLDIRVDKT